MQPYVECYVQCCSNDNNGVLSDLQNIHM